MHLLLFDALVGISNLSAQSSDSKQVTPTKPKATLSGVREQRDVVLGKKKRTLALLQQVSVWYEVDPKHPEALAKAKELRQFYKSFLEESLKLNRMYQEVAAAANSWGKLSKEEQDQWTQRDNDILEIINSDEIDSKLRQLEAMGFDHTLDGWK